MCIVYKFLHPLKFSEIVSAMEKFWEKIFSQLMLYVAGAL